MKTEIKKKYYKLIRTYCWLLEQGQWGKAEEKRLNELLKPKKKCH